mmetsp:Transcript_139464/g.446181  ORF Transcript_139464/g.446181 Transcript_139464/m.446181 type:complete len:154 (+) Transcript_139464:193-654(+)
MLPSYGDGGLDTVERTCLDYGFLTEPEAGLGGRRVPFNTGHCLGRGTAINNGLYGVEWSEPAQMPWIEWADTCGLADWHPVFMAPCVTRAAAMLAPQVPAEYGRLQVFDIAMAQFHKQDGQHTAAPPKNPPSRVAWCIDWQGSRLTAASAYLG